MGRHSAPDDDAVDESALATTESIEADATRGRHSLRDEGGVPGSAVQDDQFTQMITIIDPDVAVDDTQETGVLPPVTGTKPPKPPKAPKVRKPPKAARKKREGESNTQADLRLLRESTAARAQVLAAVVASFVLYTVVMVVIGKTSSYVLWIWIPIVVAGVGVGAVLDAAHRRVKRDAPGPPGAPTDLQPSPDGQPPTGE